MTRFGAIAQPLLEIQRKTSVRLCPQPCDEALKRMAMPDGEVRLDFSLIDGLNGFLRKVFVKAKARSTA